MRFTLVEPHIQKIGGNLQLWQKCKYNPISDISLDYYEEGCFKWRRTIFKYCNEPKNTYCTIDVSGSNDDWYKNPIEYIKKVLPTSLYNSIYFYLDPLGTLILLKGNFNEFPMSDIQRYFDIEILSMNKFALCEKGREAYKAEIFAYLETAANKVEGVSK